MLSPLTSAETSKERLVASMMIHRPRYDTYLMTHERHNSPECLIAVIQLWKLDYLTCIAKSLVMMGQRQCVILGWEEAVELLEDEILRVGEHVVEGSRTR